MGAFLLIAFLVVPIVEIWVIIQVGQVIGPLPTVLLLIVESLIGAWIVRHEGRAAWRALRESAGSGRLPGRELSDAGLVLVGGTLLLTPGFVTDVVGFFFVLPPTRPLARRLMWWLIGRRTRVVVSRRGFPPQAFGRGRSGAASPGDDPRIVPGELVQRPGEDDPR